MKDVVGNILLAVVLFLGAGWIVRAVYRPAGAYTVFMVIVLIVSIAFFASNPDYTTQARLLYTTKASTAT